MGHPVWWEKTVEYYFVKKFVKDDEVIAPLDGKHELAGDAMLAAGLKWVLIEFKKDDTCLESEAEKFRNYQLAVNELSSQDNHHYLIYGLFGVTKASPETKVFGIGACTYFSRSGLEDYQELLGSGTDIQTFARYLEALTKHKKQPPGDGSAGGMNMANYAQVLGINADGKVVTCSSQAEFGKALGMTLQKQLTHTPTRQMNGPERGGMSR